jgi:hypothetical protein
VQIVRLSVGFHPTLLNLSLSGTAINRVDFIVGFHPTLLNLFLSGTKLKFQFHRQVSRTLLNLFVGILLTLLDSLRRGLPDAIEFVSFRDKIGFVVIVNPKCNVRRIRPRIYAGWREIHP